VNFLFIATFIDIRESTKEMTALSTGTTGNLWEIFLLFTIPVGGGIPAGVVLAKARGVGWLTMTLLYLVSDILLAFLFEPMMLLYVYASKHFEFLKKFSAAIKKSMHRTISGFGSSPGPIMLITIAFGVDPMTGRAAALAAGHNFLTGWAIAIIGDMIFFGVVMTSTLWLNEVLGDGSMAALIIMILMLGIPALIRKFRKSPFT